MSIGYRRTLIAETGAKGVATATLWRKQPIEYRLRLDDDRKALYLPSHIVTRWRFDASTSLSTGALLSMTQEVQGDSGVLISGSTGSSFATTVLSRTSRAAIR